MPKDLQVTMQEIRDKRGNLREKKDSLRTLMADINSIIEAIDAVEADSDEALASLEAAGIILEVTVP